MHLGISCGTGAPDRYPFSASTAFVAPARCWWMARRCGPISFAVACEGRQVTTIEGHDADPVMQRLRAAFTRHHAPHVAYARPACWRRRATSCCGRAGEGRAARQAAFAGFTPVADSAGAAAKPASVPPPPRRPAEERPGQPDRRRFHRALPAAEVWAFMVDLPALASCLPGASIEEHEGDRVKGKIAIVRTHVRRLQRRGPPGATTPPCRRCSVAPGRTRSASRAPMATLLTGCKRCRPARRRCT